jgi:cell division protein FtsL
MDPITAGGVAAVIGSMATTTKTVIEIVKTARTKVKNPEVEKSLSDALEQIFSLQTSMIDLQAKILSLQEENSELRGKIRQEEERAKKREQYKRKTVGGAVVYFREEEPDIHYCPACLESKNQGIPLQKVTSPLSIMGSRTCPQCHAYLP